MATIIPRMSEKGVRANQMNKYVFTVKGKINKIELRHSIEKTYGVKVADVNMIAMKGKFRRYGKASGQTSAFKKAIVTLTKDSKKIEIASPV